MADISKDWLLHRGNKGRRNTPHHSYTSGSKNVPACVRK